MVLSPFCLLQSSFVRQITVQHPSVQLWSQQAGPAPWISLAGLLLRGGIWSFPVKRGRENKTLSVNLDTAFII